MKRIIIALSLIALSSCKKEDCSCGKVAGIYEYSNEIYVSNVCSNKLNKFYVPLVDAYSYEVGKVYCGDNYFIW